MKTSKESKSIEQSLLTHAIFFCPLDPLFHIFHQSHFAIVTFKSIGHHAGLLIYQTLHKGANVCSHNTFFSEVCVILDPIVRNSKVKNLSLP